MAFTVLLKSYCDSFCSLLDNNRFLGCISPQLHELKMLSECQEDQDQLTDATCLTLSMSRSTSW